MIETTGLRQFSILLYKGMLLRKRHYIVTFFEVVIPILIACIPCILQSETAYPSHDEHDIRPRKPEWVNYTTFPPFDPYYTQASQYYDLQFVYAPGGPITDQFMKEAIEMFKANTGYTGNI
ncbi:uncharacterized protein TNCT_434771, partial [Trichonephila clavata]